jgi:hypothetical protein
MRQRCRLSASRKAGFSAGFRHRVYGFHAKRLIFCPIGDETPPHEAEDASGLLEVLANGGDLLSRDDVPAWVPSRIFIEAEVIPQVALLAVSRERPHMIVTLAESKGRSISHKHLIG